MARVKDPAKIDRLFEAALHHVLETGYAGLKMAEVAREAGVATGTIYTYFGGKADLINQLYRHLKQQKRERVLLSIPLLLPVQRLLKSPGRIDPQHHRLFGYRVQEAKLRRTEK